MAFLLGGYVSPELDIGRSFARQARVISPANKKSDIFENFTVALELL
ncbi:MULTISPECIES: hypothetical protein [Lactiplantibacillus]|jgi:hypothetical protein|uniref:Uncharacterized protein n=1 Tax=Lactiplantibacillus pentosus TaxID=1589 RepID=A0AAX6LIA9_LACPE|nr:MULTISPECIES: hypothetical protein [Lactiplantibacillus]MBO9165894.1 hypothetical protein [Lactiplantibacillus pentosus]MBU7496485.1 hypothetical protein [Lactiplantibacillus pentosus]MCB5220399.1 hypothetical protein [Lactiplantibacillus pentosus]MCC3161678.1 hypothetical protein [Lactiplantibacillus pentosus]MCJ8187624.1 hypothetical protein [Lactiplantibacillus pentosus]